MEPRISIITLGVAEMAASIRFYRDGLGWPTSAADDAGWAIFRTAGTRFALYPRDALAEDACLGAEGTGFGGITLAHNVRRRKDVEAVIDRAVAAGARLLKAPQPASWGGYTGYFADLDGYPWEVAWSEAWEFDEDGVLWGGSLGPPAARAGALSAHPVERPMRELHFALPHWLGDAARVDETFPTVGDRMRHVVDLSHRNVLHETGGPFAAGIFDAGGALVAAGVNVVVPQDCSILHAEVVAIALAQRRLARYDLSEGGRLGFELVASTEPCAMCFGALPWSGVTRLACGARAQDARVIGFDEGPKPQDWVGALEARGIRVTRDVLREDAAAVLRLYAERGGVVYNARG
jgi:tRNA(Arg) A34 adenosine deaminase TadA/catechol 2,3-dioxygenase-like lactoylglutathione lyase family enzyme